MPESQTSSRELLAVLDRTADTPLHEQLTRSLREAVRSGRLHGGALLPSSRRMADELGVSRALVVEAYSQLVAEGYLVARKGAGTRAAALPTPPASRAARASTPPRFAYDLRPGRPDAALFPRRAWLTALRHAVSDATEAELGDYPDPAGPPRMREALAAYLGRVRGARADADRIVACAGVAQGLGLIAGSLAERGVRRVAVEDPSSPGTREVLAAHGLETVGVPVDALGLQVDALEHSGAQAVLATPAHQFPSGVVLDPGRRSALLSWAERDRWIIEDDYDAEFRYDRAPISALQGLSPERVIYVGSASKTLSPALRLGWVVAPDELVDAIRERKRLADLGCPTLDALAFAHLLTSGGYDRHLRRARSTYRRRREALSAALTESAPHLPILGAAAGLHLTLALPDAVSERLAVERAGSDGVAVTPLGPQYVDEPTGFGLLLGYAAIPEPTLNAASQRLHAALHLEART